MGVSMLTETSEVPVPRESAHTPTTSAVRPIDAFTRSSAPVPVVAPLLVPLRRRLEVGGVGAQVLPDRLFVQLDAEPGRIGDDGEAFLDERLAARRPHQRFPPWHVARVVLEPADALGCP